MQWDRLEVLFEQALDLPSEERAAFLDQACADEPALRTELQSLLTHYEEAPAFLDELAEVLPHSASSRVGARQQADPFGLAGTRLAHYFIHEKLGGGGMGVVYRAEDTRLHRPVALKFLPPHLSSDDRARQRFLAEARAASALDHPNICTIYEIGETESEQTFIAMAHYEGRTLKRIIEDGPLPFEQALNYVAQVARGLEKAHGAGILHRDIKPANVMVTGDGIVKILDFGLAKMANQHLTRTGSMLGTVAYMSPEQVRGEPLDQRSDLWNLGVLFYELLTGERPFKGEYEQAIIYSILHKPPSPPSSLKPDIPSVLDDVVFTCLEPDLSRRYQDASILLSDLSLLLHESRSRSVESTVLHARRKGRLTRRVKIVLAVSALATAAVILLLSPLRNGLLQAAGIVPNVVPLHLAVLPFSASGADSTAGDLAEGLRLAITSTLNQLEKYTGRPLRIVPASEVRDMHSAREARAAFGVDQALTGSIIVDALIRLDLTLIDAAEMDQLRSVFLTAPPDEVASMQAGLVSSLAELLELSLTPDAHAKLTAGGTNDSRAYTLYLKGQVALERLDRSENVDTAIDLFNYALEVDPRYALAHAGLGEAYWHKYAATKDSAWVPLAEASSARALEIEDQLAPVHVTLGTIYLGTGQYEKAVRAYSLALALDSTEVEAFNGLGHAYGSLNRLEEAERAYKQAVRVAPQDHRAYTFLGNYLLRTGKFEEAAAQYRHVIALTPDNFQGYNNIGAIFLYQKKLDSARVYFERSIAVHATPSAYSNLGAIAYNERRYEDEVEMYERAVSLDSTNIRIWANLAGSYERAFEDGARVGQIYRRALAIAQEQLRVNPNDATLLRMMAQFQQNIGQEAAALASLERALTLEPGSIETMFRAGLLYEKQGRRDKALQWIGQALRQGYPLEDIHTIGALASLRADARFLQIIRDLNKQ